MHWKLLAILLSLGLVTTVTACGPTDDAGLEEDPAPTEEVAPVEEDEDTDTMEEEEAPEDAAE